MVFCYFSLGLFIFIKIITVFVFSPLFLFQSLQVENDTLKKTLEKIQSQLDTSLDAQDQQRKVLEAINRQFGDHVNSLGELHNELNAVLNT